MSVLCVCESFLFQIQSKPHIHFNFHPPSLLHAFFISIRVHSLVFCNNLCLFLPLAELSKSQTWQIHIINPLCKGWVIFKNKTHTTLYGLHNKWYFILYIFICKWCTVIFSCIGKMQNTLAFKIYLPSFFFFPGEFNTCCETFASTYCYYTCYMSCVLHEYLKKQPLEMNFGIW